MTEPWRSFPPVSGIKLLHRPANAITTRRRAYEKAWRTVEVYKFMDNMPAMFACVDLIVSRAEPAR